MNVEMVGGPNDGAVYALQGNPRAMMVYRPTPPVAMASWSPDDDPPVAITTEAVALPVMRRVSADGRVIDHVVLWPKGWS